MASSGLCSLPEPQAGSGFPDIRNTPPSPVNLSYLLLSHGCLDVHCQLVLFLALAILSDSPMTSTLYQITPKDLGWLLGQNGPGG
jgi:hypothetical protein